MRVPVPIFFPTLPPLEDPIRAELFGIERLEQHAESLAAAQRVAPGSAPRQPLLPRVEANGRVLRDVNRAIADAAREEPWMTPAAEWLADNFFVVDEQLREIREDLPEGFYRELPALAEGPLAGYPRVYGIAWAFVAHTDSRFDPEALRRFIHAYQRVQPLTIGELWAVTISLRVVLVENIRRLAEAVMRGRAARREADALADELLGDAELSTAALSAVMSRNDNPRLVTAFAVELVQRLRDRDPAVTPALAWLHQRLAGHGTSAEEIVLVEHQRQAALTVTVRNVITSMRQMSALDWPEFFERVSLVDAKLRDGSDFAAMDFASRDAYRHAIEALARGSGHTELDVADAALAQARSARELPDPSGARDARWCDPGFHLIGAGRRAFERTIGFRPSIMLRLRRAFVDAATPGYLGTLLLVTAAVLAVPLVIAAAQASRLELVVMGILALIPASDAAVALVNRFATTVVAPSILPRLEWLTGVPTEYRTLVAVPTLFTGRDDVDAQVDQLEVHYLANADGDVRFALISDWVDAATEHTPLDAEIVAAARDGIARLNAKHGPAPDGGDRFAVFHRRRVWNASQGVCMGWERKRGKLHELNRLLRGATDTTFLPAGEGSSVAPPGVRYVVTLDADTRVPIGAIKRLVGTMAHPLNRPRFDARTGRVVQGYGVLQPRVTPPLPGRGSSVFQRLSSGASGIDPYAAAVSDVYQDLFGEGSFTGKGIYDVDAFEAALANRVPDNTLLSHDLFEGIFARAGLVTDIEVFESAPSHYLAAAARQHRWARGDWQLLPWILRERVSLVARWKMVDNLRRTLSAPTAVLTLIAGWAWPGVASALWTKFIIAVIAIPPLIPVAAGVWPRSAGFSKRSYFRSVARDVRAAVGQIALTLTTLAFRATLMADAIMRTLWRLVVTHRRMLEWRAMVHTVSRAPDTRAGYYQQMTGGLIVTALAAVTVAWRRPGIPLDVVPIILLWTLAPTIARAVSLPARTARDAALSPDDARTLRLIARRTWGYFASFVTTATSYLPPDNFQETPQPVVAPRTSPTNIGLYLLSVVTARDFGWVGLLDAVDRLEATMHAVSGLEHHRGHLYNWYDTGDARALEPKYISSVDSGNLAGALLALANACEAMSEHAAPVTATLSGIRDAALLLREAVHNAASEPAADRVALDGLGRVDAALDQVFALLARHPDTPSDRAHRVDKLDAAMQAVSSAVAGAAPKDAPPSLLVDGAETLRAAMETHARDLDTFLPWARQSVDAAAAPAVARLIPAPSPSGMPARCAAALRDLAVVRAGIIDAGGANDPRLQSIDALAAGIERSAAAATAVNQRLIALAAAARDMFHAMEFGFLFDPHVMLFAIGYRMNDGCLDPSRYDLLASEARLLSFIAIAKGDVPVRHWFRLGRLLTTAGRDSALLSWSGSMFEYLMPSLVMRAPAGSLLEQSCRLAVERQITYGNERGVPWGTSESGYFARNLEMTFQYSNFGVPALGLRRGLADDVVVAPYATALASMYAPGAAVRNFETLKRAGASGKYGFYEAVDYTPARLPADTDREVVQMYMAHHQGMAIVAIGNVLHRGRMRSYFHAEPIVRASELLLQERTPRDVAVARLRLEAAAVRDVRELVPPRTRHFTSPHSVPPQAQLLSNGRYTVMVTTAGSGYSRWHDLAITRWREDTTRDDTGSFIYLRDAASGERWSVGFQPTAARPESYDVSFTEDRAEFVRRDGALTTRFELIVSSEDDAEVRRVQLTNHGARAREIEITSYAEVVLAPAAADAAHPAFSNLFVETEVIAEQNTLLATRRRRAPEDPEVWLAHVVAVDGETVGDLQWETDRGRFLGRGNAVRAPRSETDGGALSGTVGAVLDPILSLRRRVRVGPDETVRLAFSTIVAPSRSAVLDLADKYHDVATFERAATLAWTQAQVQLHHLGIGHDEAHLFQSLGGSLLYGDRALRASIDVLTRQAGGQESLWAHGISGDLPIVMVEIDDVDDIGLVRQLLRAHAYWRMKRLAVDLVIVNDRAPSYVQDLQTLIETLVRTSQSMPRPEGFEPAGKVYTLRADHVTGAQYDVLTRVARVMLSNRRGTLAEQVARAHRAEPAPLTAPRSLVSVATPAATPTTTHRELEFFNGLGGFANDGREYVIILNAGQWTPAPWINVIANPQFGCLVSEMGAGCTWSMNSQGNLLTPWTNDPVSDPPSDMLYIRDEETGDLWSPTPAPIRDHAVEYVVRHGHGYTRHTCEMHDIRHDLLQFVPADDPVKISRLTLTNKATRPRRVSVTAYLDWVLGVSRSASAPFVTTEMDADTGAMFAQNEWNREFANRIAFADMGGAQKAWTADRTEFLGRNGTSSRPAALGRRDRMTGHTGAGYDPCCALQTTVEIPAGGVVSVVFSLGQAESREAARALVRRGRAADIDAQLKAVIDGWTQTLERVQVRTPDRSLDLLLNRWLLYQTLACRVWARTAFYQASGAYGFRDQLQDVMALVHARPDQTRAQIIRAASRQFVEGDVQHWWHEPTGRGVRTRISDDLLWLPYVTGQYLDATADHAILDALVPFLDGAVLAPGQAESYFEPRVSGERASLFEHCARAIDRSLSVGTHGLPLMGTGDWNDGMNRVGSQGKGESVWLAWFLHGVLTRWAPVAAARNESKRAEVWLKHARALGEAAERTAWGGTWYRRAYFDDGTPLGENGADACAIDSIAQSWGVISGAADPDRARRAMASVEEHLLRRGDNLSLLLTPPFDHTALEPGYIKGYVPGVRENGGQYSHAAAWTAIAFAMLGDGDRAAELIGWLNPVKRTASLEDLERYRVEPYVAVGDVYSVAPHAGRGGWTWYTGTAGWLYRAGIEWLLGIRVRGPRLIIEPCIPGNWPGFTATYRHHTTTYNIAVENPRGVCRGVATLELDGVPIDVSAGITLANDGHVHQVHVVLGEPVPTTVDAP